MRRLLISLAVFAACTTREKPPMDAVRDTLPAAQPRDTTRPRDRVTIPIAAPYNPDDSGPADTPQWLSMMEDRKRRGVDFFGAGQEPGWIIEIDDGKRLYLLANYAADTMDIVAPAPVPDPAVPGKRSYRATGDGHTVVVTIEPRTCSDAMSGKRYAETVTLIFDGKTYDGCGRKIE